MAFAENVALRDLMGIDGIEFLELVAVDDPRFMLRIVSISKFLF